MEHEHLLEYGQAIEYFNRALQVNNEQLGRESHLTKVINEGLISVMQKHQKKMVIINAYAAGIIPSANTKDFLPKGYFSNHTGTAQTEGSPRKNNIYADSHPIPVKSVESSRKAAPSRNLSNPRGGGGITNNNNADDSLEAYGSTNRVAFDSYSRNEDFQRPSFIKGPSKIVYDLTKRKAASTLRGRKLAQLPNANS